MDNGIDWFFNFLYVDFGLAAAIATLIFLLVGALAIVNLKATRMKFD
ncbi:hypothetical protein JNR85_25380 [Klebsiella pneumoniae]|nr:hypothetical protein [Klebsiella pneumoniae]